jgi:hypothetical protein
MPMASFLQPLSQLPCRPNRGVAFGTRACRRLPGLHYNLCAFACSLRKENVLLLEANSAKWRGCLLSAECGTALLMMLTGQAPSQRCCRKLEPKNSTRTPNSRALWRGGLVIQPPIVICKKTFVVLFLFFFFGSQLHSVHSDECFTQVHTTSSHKAPQQCRVSADSVHSLEPTLRKSLKISAVNGCCPLPRFHPHHH